jgi:transcriptional regulator of acetoin/glycerol metabolism
MNEQYFDHHENDIKDSAYDLSTTSSTSTINPVTAATSNGSHSNSHHLSRLLHEESMKQNAMDIQERLNGAASTSRKILKHSPLQNPFASSSSLVTVMMDENKPPHDIEDHSFYMPLRRDENGHISAAEYDEGKQCARANSMSEKILTEIFQSFKHSELASQKIIPKVERADTPVDLAEEEDNENIMCSPAEHLQSIFLTNEEREEWKDVVRMSDYLTKGRRPQFWEEPFTKRVLDAIKNKNLEMKKAAKLLGVSYGTLYGRYRETYGCLKHPYR